jgi:hypothetical protein
MKTLPVTVALALLLFATSVQSIEQASDEAKRVTEAMTVLDEIMAAADKAIPREILEKAEVLPCSRRSSRAVS